MNTKEKEKKHLLEGERTKNPQQSSPGTQTPENSKKTSRGDILGNGKKQVKKKSREKKGTHTSGRKKQNPTKKKLGGQRSRNVGKLEKKKSREEEGEKLVKKDELRKE